MLYQLLRLIGIPVIYLLFFPKIVGRKNMRIKGKAIIISNHISMWDPLLISALFRRQIYWMGKIELFKNRIARAFFHIVKAFPVRRGEGDLAAIRHAFRILRDGKIFGIFPEGTRVKGSSLRKFEPGTSMIAMKSGAPILPLYIKGSYKLFRRMKLIVGEPIFLPDYVGAKTDPHAVEAATAFLNQKVEALRNTTI